mmetsp:Transcript_16034/g.23802  ORF Transcript_16034/g.23802 Transcript_16034/m.23802 type:complete len:88 (-) Transcript_16034:624-887(-)
MQTNHIQANIARSSRTAKTTLWAPVKDLRRKQLGQKTPIRCSVVPAKAITRKIRARNEGMNMLDHDPLRKLSTFKEMSPACKPNEPK